MGNQKKQKHLKVHRENIIGIFTVVGLMSFIIYKVITAAYGVQNNSITALENAAKPKITFRQYACISNSDDGASSSEVYVAPSQKTIARYASAISGANLIANSNLELRTSNGQPLNFNHTNGAGTSYSTLRDETGQTFLRSSSDHPPKDETIAWLADTTPIKNKAYYFSFLYRSDAAADLTIEYTDSKGARSYYGYNELSKVDSWQRVEGHIDNYDGAGQRVRLIVGLKSSGNLDVSALQLFELNQSSLGSGMVSVTFDDSWQSIFDSARPLLKKYNILTTQFAIAGYNEQGVKGYMSVKQLLKLQDEGHEISSHSLRHCNQTQLDTSDLIYDLGKSKSLLESHQLKPTGFAYPYGAYNYTTETFVKQQFSYARTTTEGFNDYFTDVYKIKTENITSDTTEQDIANWTKYAKQHRLWLVLVYHRVNEDSSYGTTAEQLDKQLKTIKDSGLTILTVRSAVSRL